MSYQKLTYSGSVCNSYLYFSFVGQPFDPEIITTALSLKPTSFQIRNTLAAPEASWDYRIDAGDAVDLERVLEKILDIFEPKVNAIRQIKEEMLLETWLTFVIDIEISPEASTPFFNFNKRTIDFLHQTGTQVSFDLYKVDKNGALNKPEL